MIVRREDVETVANDLKALEGKLTAMSILTAEDEKRFVQLVRECVKQVRGVSELSWGETVRRMQTMQP